MDLSTTLTSEYACVVPEIHVIFSIQSIQSLWDVPLKITTMKQEMQQYLPCLTLMVEKFIEHMSTYTVNITSPGNLPFYIYDF